MASRDKIEEIVKEIDEAAGSLSSEYSRKRIMGSEQEYGIWVPGSMELEDRGWDIEREGFLENGARLYIDCDHPEYASPEASNPLDAVLFDKAGELIVSRCVKPDNSILFKHNRDNKGNSFASHENYSLNRVSREDNEFTILVEAVLPFFTTRIIFAGAGFINDYGHYELSQKAETTTHETTTETANSKGIFNTRDEPLTEDSNYMRVHVVSGDANLSEPALFLKFGTAGLVLDLYEDKKLKFFKLEDSVSSFHGISRDLDFSKKYPVGGNGEMTAIEIQRAYQEAAESAYRGGDDMTDDILNRWKFVLDNLKEGSIVLDRWLDWKIKKKLIDSYRERTSKDLDDVSVRNIDLQYHNIDRTKGLFYKLQNSGMVDRLVSDDQIEFFSQNPPEDTRARIRGVLAAQQKLNNQSLDWGEIRYRSSKPKILEKCERCSTQECIHYGYRDHHIKLDDPFNAHVGLEDTLDKDD